MGLYWGAFNAVAFRTQASFGASSDFFEPLFFRAYCAGIHLHPWGVRAVLSGAGHVPRARGRKGNVLVLWQQVLSSQTSVCGWTLIQGGAEVQAHGDALR